MTTHSIRVLLTIGAALTLRSFLAIAPAIAANGDTTADSVLGQVNFTDIGANITANRGMDEPDGVAIDMSVSPNRIYVADSQNNRVLAWQSVAAFTNGAPADKIFGQPNSRTINCNNIATSLCFPTGVAVDSLGDLYVADGFNNRVLEFDHPFAGGDTLADRVFGHNGSFTNGNCNFPVLSASSLCLPEAVAVDASDRLYISDSNNSRVLEFDHPLTSQTANRVFGQGGHFDTQACNKGGSVNPNTLCGPRGLATFGNDLFIADFANNRVLEYNNPVGTNNTTADVVIGQASGTANICATSNHNLCTPVGVAVDSGGALYVVDQGNSRVVLFKSPLTTDHVADKVFGQNGDFSTTLCNKRNGTVSGVTNNTLCQPVAAAVDENDNLYIADRSDNRVTEYNAPVPGDTTADKVLGQINFTNDGANITSLIDLNAPARLAIDRTVTPNRFYVADPENNRVLAWNNPAAFTNGLKADLVLGQAGFGGSDCNRGGVGYPPTASTLCGPRGVAVDSKGRLYVADTRNFRVLEFDTPFANRTANRVFGQSSFTNNVCSPASASSMCGPTGVALDAGDHLFVADPDNNRVLEFDMPLSSSVANRVWGQSDKFNTTQCNEGSTPSNKRLCFPTDVAVDKNGNLYVSDNQNSRILEFNNALSSDKIADHVFGQKGSFTTGGCRLPTTDSLCNPKAVGIDGAANLYVADTGNSRILKYTTPLSNQVADMTFGQLNSFTDSVCATFRPGADGLCLPEGVAIDTTGNVYISDTEENRVLRYDAP